MGWDGKTSCWYCGYQLARLNEPEIRKTLGEEARAEILNWHMDIKCKTELQESKISDLIAEANSKIGEITKLRNSIDKLELEKQKLISMADEFKTAKGPITGGQLYKILNHALSYCEERVSVSVNVSDMPFDEDGIFRIIDVDSQPDEITIYVAREEE